MTALRSLCASLLTLCNAQVQEVVTQLQDIPIPEELTPLKAALDAARTAVEKATADREDLEAKVRQRTALCARSQAAALSSSSCVQAQQLTSVAISAKDELLSARKELDNAVVGAESASVVKLNLANEVDHLHRAAEEGGGLQGASLATGTVELTDAKDPAQVQTLLSLLARKADSGLSCEVCR